MRAHFEDDNGEHYYREDPNAEDRAYDEYVQAKLDQKCVAECPEVLTK